jgi:cob(I)alamin adenosyltransferase
MLYTRKGDDGKTKTFNCDQRMSKSSDIAEALGSLDEINSFLGFCKVESEKEKFFLDENTQVKDIIHNVQKNLFIIQAEVAGSKISMTPEKVKEIEIIIDYVEKNIPPIKFFFISGGSKLAVLFDIARTIARQAERRVVKITELPFVYSLIGKKRKVFISSDTLAYLNRLSSLLYALARLSNHKFGIKEESPDYR